MLFDGERLKLARKYKGLTMDDLVEQLERLKGISVNKGMISRWENGKAIPRDETKEALSEILYVPLEYLLGRKCYEYQILELRHKNKISPKELAEQSGVSEITIQLVEIQLDDPTKEELQKIGKVFGFEDFHSWLVENGMPVYPEDVGLSRTDSSDANELVTFLNSKDITYQGRELSKDDKQKILDMLQVLFS